MKKLQRINRVLLTLLIVFIFIPLFPAGTAQADVYSSYKQLAAKQTRNQDYRITSKNASSNIAVIAIHGGKIEIGTCKIAKSVAKIINSNLYTFEGIKNKNNSILHITSARFDEPTARKIVGKSRKTLSIHGCRGSNRVTYVGGLDKNLGSKVRAELKKAGFKVAIPPRNLAGTSPKNICNKNQIKKGVQLELTYNMRQTLLNNKTLYNKYVKALGQALK